MLTFEERVAYQRAIEEVYWRHRIWPKENADPKPQLDAVISQVQLEKKVAEYLRNSQALEDYWQRPITAEQLQAEMDRMASHTKQPEVLQELFEALGNDPFVIAECLARPAFAERLLTNWYAYDQRIHGELKQRAETELQMRASVEQMKKLSGKYSEIEFVKGDRSDSETLRGPERGVRLTSHDWDETVQKLAVSFGARRHAAAFQSAEMSAHSVNAATKAYEDLSVGNVSPLQEDEERYYVTAVIEKSNDCLKLATVSWPKEPLEAWLARDQNQVQTAITAPGGNYTLPKISGGGCVEDTWTATAGASAPRRGHTAVWTGTEMIVWGGSGDTSGDRYNPSTDTWVATSTTNAPGRRSGYTAVWTGSEMMIWGGQGGGFPVVDLDTGGRYNPSTDSWTTTSVANAPFGRHSHTAIWTGSEMIIWGGVEGTFFTHFNSGGRYDPDTNTWTSTSTTGAPSARAAHTAVWTGSEMIVWGGNDENFNLLNTGGRYNPVTNSWVATSTTNVPTGRNGHTAVWTGSQMIVWGGGHGNSDLLNTGGRYNPGTNSWTATSITNAPEARNFHTAVWSGSEIIVWGGQDEFFNLLNTGGRYNPGTNSWAAPSITNAPSARAEHTAVWTGSEMIVWGGTPDTFGGRYNPNTNSWTPTASAPAPRYFHTAVWTGSEMIIWGGISASFSVDTGGRYNPSTDSWAATNITNAPDGRYDHTAVWTGTEMIVWGGWGDNFVVLNSGGKYNPTLHSWRVITTANAPVARRRPTAVWTGSEMIVWGGEDENFDRLNTGGRYIPSRDSWAATSITNAPGARDLHTAVWTGSEMIVWGGEDENYDPLNTGGRYDPGTNSWTATSTVSPPEARPGHTGVWTGTEMIVWGGYSVGNTGGRYNLATNSWTATSVINAPDARVLHTAVWTGTEMIIWGGLGGGVSLDLNSGGRYDPNMDSWAPTSITNAPEARDSHTAVWTGNEMIVWGGSGNSGGRYCAQGGPTPTPTPSPTPCTTCPTPRPRPTPRVRPTPR